MLGHSSLKRRSKLGAIFCTAVPVLAAATDHAAVVVVKAISSDHEHFRHLYYHHLYHRHLFRYHAAWTQRVQVRGWMDRHSLLHLHQSAP